ncbi:MAG TPA: prolyl oligopeptidase family serine peptidase [Acidisphaera sp.]|nr:prolyl oligopeptidase family serine peptidase [Acidisphaera sp.]
MQFISLTGPRFGARPGRARMLVVLCHGVGADGRDVIGLATHWAGVLPGAAFAAPHAPFPYDQAPFGRQWFSLADRSLASLEAGVRTAWPILDRFVDAELARLALPPDAYALAGFSQGAMMALFAGLRRDIAPRAILSFSGALIAPGALADERQNEAPVMLVHGTDDDVVPAQLTRHAEAVLHAEGIPVRMRLTPGLGHAIDEAGVAIGGTFLRHAFATVSSGMLSAAE